MKRDAIDFWKLFWFVHTNPAFNKDYNKYGESCLIIPFICIGINEMKSYQIRGSSVKLHDASCCSLIRGFKVFEMGHD